MNNKDVNLILKKLELIENSHKKLINRNEELIKKIELFEKKLILKEDNENKKEIKREKLKYNLENAKKCILLPIIEGEIELFKYLYLDSKNKEYYPVKNIKNKLYYWLNNEWIEDDGNYIKNTILKNIATIYLEINNLSNFNDELFIRNQKKIFDLRDDENKNIKNKWINNLKKISEIKL